jgi:hypothetical protein
MWKKRVPLSMPALVGIVTDKFVIGPMSNRYWCGGAVILILVLVSCYEDRYATKCVRGYPWIKSLKKWHPYN